MPKVNVNCVLPPPGARYGARYTSSCALLQPRGTLFVFRLLCWLYCELPTQVTQACQPGVLHVTLLALL